MKKVNLIKSLAFCAATLFTVSALALPNVKGRVSTEPQKQSFLKGTAAACVPATAAIDLDINNVRAHLMTGGDMWWDIGTSEARYEVPKGSKKNSLFAGSVWIGGYDPQGNLKVAAQTYRQNGNDYWPGPLDDKNTTEKAICSDWDKFWKVNGSDILAFQQLIKSGEAAVQDPKFDVIKTWPAQGNPDAVGVSGLPLIFYHSGAQSYAPFVDLDGNGKYDWRTGDYPSIQGDQFIWWVFNDAGNTKLESQTASIGLEVQASAFAFSSKDFKNDATFYKYRLINRGSQSLDSTYIATWTDADLGDAFDDYIGCDTTRGLGILYNGKSVDGNGQVNSYGSQVPMVGVDFFVGPKRRITINGIDSIQTLGMTVFSYFNNDFGTYGNPVGGAQIYNYMTGTNRAGQHLRFDQADQCTGWSNGPLTSFAYFGDPGIPGTWSECACNKTPYDRRFVHSSGPFKLDPGGATNDITIGAVWVADVGGCPNTSFKKIKSVDDQAQALFESGFKAIEGPQAPTLVVREMNRQLIFYILNDSISNNFQERYGRDTAAKYRESTRKMRNSSDSLYKFEGYRVFQLKGPNVTVFKENGDVDETVAREVFQTDIKNGVGRIVNFTRSDIADTLYIPTVQVAGKDSGLVHSFVLTNDQFSTTSDKRFVNYRNYYFKAYAYAYNNFRSFNSRNVDSTQDVAYLAGEKGPGGTVNPVVTAMPNPANGDAGTVLGQNDMTTYGTGVIIKRLEGQGNGHNSLQIRAESENEALLANSGYQSKFPLYEPGLGPVNVKVVDPRMVKAADFELFLQGQDIDPLDPNKGLRADSTKWHLIANGTDTIYSEKNIAVMNEQILAKYGISVSIQQVKLPGQDQPNGNGYIGSDVIFNDPSKAWLAGVTDGELRAPTNWIRSGKNSDTSTICHWSDNFPPSATSTGWLDSFQAYESIFLGNVQVKSTWAPYSLAAWEPKGSCGFGVAQSTASQTGLADLPSVDIIFTADKSKWSRVPIVELEDDQSLSEGHAKKFYPRSHRSWNGQTNSDGYPTYSAVAGDTGMTLFPGYAINQETGERLQIVIGEDSWLKNQNGADMLWNPTSTITDDFGNVIFGGKHYVYILKTKYDEGAGFNTYVRDELVATAFTDAIWVGLPTLQPGYSFNSFNDGFIPTETRLRLRVDRPYAKYVPDPNITLRNSGLPLYSFSTRGLEPIALNSDGNQNNNDKQKLLNNIMAVPNPYYGAVGYESNRLETIVRIINLPHRATINIYSLDGTLVRRVEQSDPSKSYVDWDIRNAKGLPIASGMYLIHVQAEGIGETVIRWFGAMRPIDITTF